jgi:hypothetical protein
MIIAINANSNYDGKENAKAKEDRIRAITEAARDEVEQIYAAIDPKRTKAPDPFETDPLFRPLRQNQPLGKPVMNEAGMGRQILTA